jgi:hypothetical protein
MSLCSFSLAREKVAEGRMRVAEELLRGPAQRINPHPPLRGDLSQAWER